MWKARWSRALVVLALVSSGLAPIRASADEPSAADIETALQLYKNGKELRERGEVALALERFRAAFALVETPLTALELGRTYMSMGKLIEAREVLLSVARIPYRKNESTKASSARIDAETLAAGLRPRLASLTVRVRGYSDPLPKITIDGGKVPQDAVAAPRLVNPGLHLVVLEANGRTVQSSVSLSEGEVRELDLVVPEAPTVPFVPLPPATTRILAPPTVPHEPASNAPKALIYGGFGTAIVGLGVGTVTGILTLSKASDLKQVCSPDGRCPRSSESDLDSSATTGKISTVAFAVGAAGVVFGVAGLLLRSQQPAHAVPSAPPVPPRPSTSFFVLPSGAGVHGSF